MANTIITKNSSTASSVPTAGDLVQGELAVNVTDKRLFTENASGTVVELGTNPSTIDINAGTIDGTTIGGTTPAAGSFTTGQFGTSLNVDGTATMDGLTVDGAAAINADNSTMLTFTHTTASVPWKFGADNTGNFRIKEDTADRARYLTGGDIILGYEDTGTTAKLFWDASAESLGIGTSSPSYKLDTVSTSNVLARFSYSGGASAYIYGDANVVSYGSSSSGSNSINFYNSLNLIRMYTNGTERLRIDSSGNLGLGVTPSAWGTARKAFQIGGGGGLEGHPTNLDYVALSANFYLASDNATYKRINAGYATLYGQDDGTHFWSTAASSTADSTISFTQAMTLDASGRLLLGTTTPLGAITSKNTSGFIGLSTYTSGGTVSEHTYANAAGLQIDSYQSASGSPYTKTTDIVANADSGAASQMRFFTTAAGSAPAERARIDTSGNLGLGVTNPTGKLHIEADSNGFNFKAGRGVGSLFESFQNTSGINYLYTSGANAALVFGTGTTVGAATERARIDSSGNLLVGTTSARPDTAADPGLAFNPDGKTYAYSSTDFGVWDSASTGTKFSWRLNGNVVGSIVYNASSVSYNTSSDYRLKEDWVAVADASTRIKALKPVNFAWKVDGKRVDGFLAHELAEVVPEAVTGTKDAVDADGNPVYQGIDQSKLVPLLTAALQEALAEIDSLKSRLTAAGL